MSRIKAMEYTLFLTRNALQELIDNDFAYLHLLAEIEAEVRATFPATDVPDEGTKPKTDEN